MVKVTEEFDFFRCLSFDPKFYGRTVSELHAGNLRRSESSRYASLLPGDRVSYWSDDPLTATAEARKYNPGLDLITFHAYDDASSTFPTSDCREPLIVVDGRETGFAEIIEKLDAGAEPNAQDRSLIDRIGAEEPDCMMYESHVRKGRCNFLFFEKGFEKLSEAPPRAPGRGDRQTQGQQERNRMRMGMRLLAHPGIVWQMLPPHRQDRHGRRAP